MSWLLPRVELPSGGRVRSAGAFNSRAYHRAYYHAKRKPRKQTYTPEQVARRRKQRMAQYYRNVDRERASARARYWARKTRTGSR